MRALILTCMALGLASGAIAQPAPAPAPAPAQAQEAPFKRIVLSNADQARGDRDFTAFLEQLQKAVDQKNTDFLLERVWDGVHNDAGIGPGKKAFLEHWNLGGSGKNSKVWGQLDALLSLGAQKVNQKVPTYAMPGFPAGALAETGNIQNAAVIAGSNVHVRAEPVRTAQSVAKETYTVVRALPDAAPKEETIAGETHPWRKVALPEGVVGYVYGKYLGELPQYRAIFSKLDGKWMLVALVKE